MKIFLFDTEAVGLQPFNFIYDIGWIITNKQGEISQRRNFLVREIITDGKKMTGAFFARKIFSYYIPAINSGKIRLVSWETIFNIMYEDLKECSTIAAYNIGYDLAALRNTANILNYGEEIIFDDLNILCLWNFACRSILNSRNYRKTARKNGWLSPSGNFKSSAECAYRYVTNQRNFIESHTALDDCLIENDIMKTAFSRKGKIPYNEYNNNPWTKIQLPGFLSRYRWGKQLEMFA